MKNTNALSRSLAIAVLVATALVSLPTSAQTVPAVEAQPPTPVYLPVPENLRAREWFQDAKFGVFLHWGLYSQLGGVGTARGAEWIMNDLGIPAKKYERLAAFFNPTDFNADRWVKSFKDAGAQYIVITAKHHEGFAMYDSKVSSYDIVEATPFKRDPMQELAAAARKHGLKLFFYYSQVDWHHPDYFPRGRTGNSTGRPHSGDWERYLQHQDAQLRELLTNYGPIGGIWFDGWWDQKDTIMRDRWQLDRTYRMIHELQPAAMILNNHHRLPFPGEDYQGFERDLPGETSMGYSQGAIGALPLEMSETMNGSWGFSLTDDKYKSPERLVRTLVSAAGRNANFLLNTGPMPNGEIQPENLATFREIGNWLKTYGKSIYGTRGGPVGPRPWGVTTQSDDRVYVHILDWQEDAMSLPLDAKVASATDLGTGKPVSFVQQKGELTLTDAAKGSEEWVRVIEIKLR